MSYITEASSSAYPFILRFLQCSQPVALDQTGGAQTDTQTGDGAGPTTTDSVEDEDESE